LADILHNQDATGRISKWAVELGALSINFKPRTTIKSQTLVDFMAEWRENQIPTPIDKPEHWTMYFDGSLKLDGGGASPVYFSTGRTVEVCPSEPLGGIQCAAHAVTCAAPLVRSRRIPVLPHVCSCSAHAPASPRAAAWRSAGSPPCLRATWIRPALLAPARSPGRLEPNPHAPHQRPAPAPARPRRARAVTPDL
jgi:hypothetical protein